MFNVTLEPGSAAGGMATSDVAAVRRADEFDGGPSVRRHLRRLYPRLHHKLLCRDAADVRAPDLHQRHCRRRQDLLPSTQLRGTQCHMVFEYDDK